MTQYYALCLDPVHVGTGGYRLGRVDMSIVRDPVTGVPKIPATSITGPARAFTALATENYDCAGKGKANGGQCGKINPACPVCVPYGFSGGRGRSLQGMAQFFDAHIYLFPVNTLIGPVWITSPLALNTEDDFEKCNFNEDSYLPLGDVKTQKLNFGWLVLPKAENKPDCSISLPEHLPDVISSKAVLVSNKNFQHIVNSNLEVRTSVSIDPATGAAKDGALFNYEAVPRGTVFRFTITYNDPNLFKLGGNDIKTEKGEQATKAWVKGNVEKGLSKFKDLGIGGMNTRGMGRMKVLSLTAGGTEE